MFDPWPVHVRFVVDKETLGQVFSEQFVLSLSVSFNQCLMLTLKIKKLQLQGT
jgi:hypothetical protein